MATEVHRITEVHEVHRIFLLPRASPYHSVSAHLTLLFAHTELYSRQAIRDARLISNPGCYATSIQALIAPLLPFLDGARPPTVFGVSGYSGAGTKAGQSGSTPGSQPVTVPKISAEDLAGGVRPYALTDHIHEREAARHLSRLAGSDVGVAFVPAVAPWFQGIISTLSAPLKQKMTAKQVREAYEAFYEGQQLVELGPNVPEVKVRAPPPPLSPPQRSPLTRMIPRSRALRTSPCSTASRLAVSRCTRAASASSWWAAWTTCSRELRRSASR
jgi:hypothetical protein